MSKILGWILIHKIAYGIYDKPRKEQECQAEGPRDHEVHNFRRGILLQHNYVLILLAYTHE